MAEQSIDRKANPKLWVFTTYFAEGLPFAIIRLMSSVFFTDIGMKERYIGYLNFLGIPWNLKFLWAPLLDIFSRKRTWMLALQTLITALVCLVALANFLVDPNQDPTRYLAFISFALIVLAFLSATNDIAIDAYYMEGLGSEEQAAFTGWRVFAYRIAMILVRSGFVAMAAWIAASEGGSANKFVPWGWAFATAAASMLAVTLFHFLYLPNFTEKLADTKQSVASILKKFGEAFVTYSKQDKFLLVIVFIIFYKVGDEVLFSMSTPFLMRELGVTKGQFAWLGGLLGAFGAIIGTSLGGIWIKKKGLKKAIWPLTILMNFNIWAYVWLAYSKPTAADTAGLITIAAIHLYEMIAAGLGNAVLVVYILRTCKPEFKASHFAIGTAIMSLFSTFFGGTGGLIVEKIGYLNLFLVAFAVSIPSMLLLLWVPIRDEVKTTEAKAHSEAKA